MRSHGRSRLFWNGEEIPARSISVGFASDIVESELVGGVGNFELASTAFLSDADMDALMGRVREVAHTTPMRVTLAAEFDHLVDVLAEARELPFKDCYELLKRAGVEVPMDDPLKVWWLREAKRAMWHSLQNTGAGRS